MRNSFRPSADTQVWGTPAPEAPSAPLRSPVVNLDQWRKAHPRNDAVMREIETAQRKEQAPAPVTRLPHTREHAPNQLDAAYAAFDRAPNQRVVPFHERVRAVYERRHPPEVVKRLEALDRRIEEVKDAFERRIEAINEEAGRRGKRSKYPGADIATWLDTRPAIGLWLSERFQTETSDLDEFARSLHRLDAERIELESGDYRSLQTKNRY